MEVSRPDPSAQRESPCCPVTGCCQRGLNQALVDSLAVHIENAIRQDVRVHNNPPAQFLWHPVRPFWKPWFPKLEQLFPNTPRPWAAGGSTNYPVVDAPRP